MEPSRRQRVAPSQANKFLKNEQSWKSPAGASAFDQWCRTTAWHGVSDFCQSETVCLKAIWLIAILCCAFVSINQCVSLSLDFASNEQWVTSVTFEKPPDNGLDWPDMTICNLNDIFPSQFAKYNMTDVLRFIDQHQIDEPNLKNDANLNELVANRMANRSISELLSVITIPCNKTAIHCGFTDRFDLRNKVNSCCDQSTASANCFSVSSLKAFGKNYKGLGRDSVYILLNPLTTEYHTNLTKSQAPSEGLRVKLFYGNPDLAVQSELLLAPGTHAMVSLIKQKHRTVIRRFRLLDFYNIITMPCSSVGNYTYYNYTSYSNKLCLLDCYSKAFTQICNCTLLPTISIPATGLKKCVGEQIVVCMNLIVPLNAKMQTGHDDPEIVGAKKCIKNCKEECEYDDIDFKISTSVFPARAKVKAFTTYLNRAFADNKMLFTEEETKRTIFFEMLYELKQIRIVEKVTRTTICELISNIGGAMGVWTGLSILSVYQCGIYFVKGLFCCRK